MTTSLLREMQFLEKKMEKINELGTSGDLNKVPRIEEILLEIRERTAKSKEAKNAWDWMQEWEVLEESFLSDLNYRPPTYIMSFIP